MIISHFKRHLLEKVMSKIYAMQGIGVTLPLEEEVSFLFNLADDTQNQVFFDVGTNFGEYAKKVLEIFPNDTQLHCFEPQKKLYEHLQKINLNASINNCGLSDKQGEATLYYDKETSGMASLSKRNLEHFNINMDLQETIKLTTIDDYCKHKNIPYIHVLKIDAEGHELSILQGAEGMFSLDKIGLIQFEFGGCNIDSKTSLQDFFYFFNEHNFSLYRMCKNQKLYPILEYKELYEIPIYQNFIACKNIQ